MGEVVPSSAEDDFADAGAPMMAGGGAGFVDVKTAKRGRSIVVIRKLVAEFCKVFCKHVFVVLRKLVTEFCKVCCKRVTVP